MGEPNTSYVVLSTSEFIACQKADPENTRSLAGRIIRRSPQPFSALGVSEKNRFLLAFNASASSYVCRLQAAVILGFVEEMGGCQVGTV